MRMWSEQEKAPVLGTTEALSLKTQGINQGFNMVDSIQTTSTSIAHHIAVIDGRPTTTTLDIAKVYGKQHAKVLAIVRQRMVEVSPEWRLANFGETVTERQNPSGGASTQSPVIRMSKKDFHFVVGKFTEAKAVQHQIAFADEFERMEQELLKQQPSTQRPYDPAIDYTRISPAQA